MTLASGTRLGGYTVSELIGMGGMGEVYRARDEKLGREVAVKVLPEALRQDSERLQRFEREARVLASLNHPGIATLYGLESADGVTFLAMELVPGETLQERLARGNLALDEVRDLFRQIAEALEAAHAAGIVHRDLKPANIKITPQGKIKILDFGLAKAFAAEEPDLDLSHSPTLTRGAGTQAGVILGTASYMSPEQAKARVVDERADIWALGCLLFESLAGRKAFDGESVTDILANVIHKDVPWDLLPAETSWRTRDVLRRCLAKDAAKRFHHVADARIELDLEDEPATIAADRRGVGSRALVAVGAGLGLFAGASLAALLLRTPEDTPPARGVERYVVYPPAADPPLEIESPAISRDGRLIAYVGIGEGERRVYLRTIDDVVSRPLDGTEDAIWPFFSPDGRWLGFFSGDKLKKVSVLGGAPQELTDAYGAGPGASWAPDDTIWFSRNWISPVYKVSSDGGEPERATVLEPDQGDVGHWWPDFLPDGKTALITIFKNDATQVIAALDMASGARKVLFPGMRARYIGSGHVVYYHAGIYQAVPFDAERLEVAGNAVPVLDGTRGLGPTGSPEAFFAVSASGTAVTVPGGALLWPKAQLSWLGRDGILEPLPFGTASFRDATLDPTGQRIAVSRNDAAVLSVWIYDLSSGTEERLTRRPHQFDPRWMPDGERLVMTTARSGAYDVLMKPDEPLGDEILLVSTEVDESAESLSPDGRWLVVTEYKQTGEDLALLDLDAESPGLTRRPLANSPFLETSASFSRDSKWVAFRSFASGRSEIYVKPVSNLDERPVRASSNGGETPVFSRTSDDLYYLSGNEVMVVSYSTTGGAFRPAAPRHLVDLPRGHMAIRVFDVAPDGRFLLLIDSGEDPPSTELHVTTNWFEELRALAPRTE